MAEALPRPWRLNKSTDGFMKQVVSPLAPRTPPAHRIVSKVPPELLKPPPSGAEPPSAAFTRPPVAWGLGVRVEFIHEFTPIFTKPPDFAAPVSKLVHRSELMLFWLKIGMNRSPAKIGKHHRPCSQKRPCKMWLHAATNRLILCGREFVGWSHCGAERWQPAAGCSPPGL